MRELKTNVSQALSDFDAIKAALEGKGVEVGDAPTSEYGPMLEALQSVNFEITDAQYLFYNNARLNALESVLALCKTLTDCHYMFYGCGALTDLDLSSLDTSQVANMQGMLWGCSSLESLNIEGMDTSSCTMMERMFASCAKLPSLDLRGFNTAKVKNFARMFDCCYALESVDMSNFDTSAATDMGNMFTSCRALKSVDFSNFDTSNVAVFTQIFSDCPALESITGFSAARSAGMSIYFPYGSASSPVALKRLTFRTDIENAIRSAIKIPYCSFVRGDGTNGGMLELINTLPDVSSLGLSSSYTAITITDNPCVLDVINVTADSYTNSITSWEVMLANAKKKSKGYDVSSMPIELYNAGSIVADTTTTIGALDKETFESYNAYKFLAHTITVPEEDKLTDEDRAIATTKGWTLVE